jgi:hypothetical protein
MTKEPSAQPEREGHEGKSGHNPAPATWIAGATDHLCGTDAHNHFWPTFLQDLLLCQRQRIQADQQRGQATVVHDLDEDAFSLKREDFVTVM